MSEALPIAGPVSCSSIWRVERASTGAAPSPPVSWCLAVSHSSMFSLVLDDGHEHVWERIGQVTDVIVLDHCTVAGCGAGHYYDPNAPAPPVRFTYVVCDPIGEAPTA